MAPISPDQLALYAGSQACVSCHPKEAGQTQTRHARTMARATVAKFGDRFRSGNSLPDPTTATVYRPELRGKQCVLVAESHGRREAVAADYAFGAGNHYHSFVCLYAGQPIELRLIYQRNAGRWTFGPGQNPGTPYPATRFGRILPDPEEGFLCHTTALPEAGGGMRPEMALPGVGCEACHGPGRAHIDAVRRHDPDLHMVRLSQFRSRISIELCGQCHRNPQSEDPKDPFTVSQIARRQGYALARSACFRKSNGQLSCVTCHDPHKDADRSSLAEYDAHCLACHTSGARGQVACKVRPTSGCVSCHMPAQEVMLPSHPRFRTHWIRVWKGSAAPAVPPAGDHPTHAAATAAARTS